MKRIIVAGLLGSLMLAVWLFTVNGLLGLNSMINMRKVADEQKVYEVLKENVTEPGRYVVNPEPAGEGRYPENEPVYGLFYSGMGHGTAGSYMIASLAVLLLVPFISAWILAQASEKVLSSYPRKIFLFFLIGILFALFSDFNQFGIDGYPLRDAALLGLSHVVLWTLMGAVIAWRIRPSGKYSMA
jgi:hypothetical protein